MKRGVWHQLGDKSQKLTLEQLERSNGVGAILSPKDLALDNAVTYSNQYNELGSQTLFDPQFYEPGYVNGHFETYDLNDFRQSVSQLCQISDQGLSKLSDRLEAINRKMRCSAVIAPACVYEAGRADKIELNSKLFAAAKSAAEAIGIPTYASVVLSSGVMRSDAVAIELLSQATAAPADGYYCAFELEDPPLPSDADWIKRLGAIQLTLAAHGIPILHAYAGLMGIVSFACGIDAVGLGHTKNLRHFSLKRWSDSTGQGGGGYHPPRFFSEALWGTLVLPDETSRLPVGLWKRIASASQHGPNSAMDATWGRWDSNKHFVSVAGGALTLLSAEQSARANARDAITRLESAAELHRQIAAIPLQVKDSANIYQANWASALKELLARNASDFDYLQLIGK